mmetsp:Transcript_30139/g.57605  ORF Transcript_30139/g.57605 Transcript_30139/m.57605 type:complete len:139 (+) Transcript_30139:62-478(+)
MVLTLHAIWPSVSWKHSLLTFLEPNIHFLTNRILAGIPLHRTTTVTRAASIETGEIWEIFWRLQGKRPGLHSNFCHPFKSNKFYWGQALPSAPTSDDTATPHSFNAQICINISIIHRSFGRHNRLNDNISFVQFIEKI